MLDVESQEGIIKAAVKPVVHSFMETGRFTESQPCEEETDEPNDQSDEEEEVCPPLEETMAASWIAQIGEEDLSETEAVDSFIAMNEQQAQELKKAARKDRGFFSSRTAVRNRANGSRQLRQSTRRSSNPMDGDGTPKDSGLTFLHTVEEESDWNAATWGGLESDEDAAWATGSPGIPPGHLIVDSAAGHALIGEAACAK